MTVPRMLRWLGCVVDCAVVLASPQSGARGLRCPRRGRCLWLVVQVTFSSMMVEDLVVLLPFVCRVGRRQLSGLREVMRERHQLSGGAGTCVLGW